MLYCTFCTGILAEDGSFLLTLSSPVALLHFLHRLRRRDAWDRAFTVITCCSTALSAPAALANLWKPPPYIDLRERRLIPWSPDSPFLWTKAASPTSSASCAPREPLARTLARIACSLKALQHNLLSVAHSLSPHSRKNNNPAAATGDPRSVGIVNPGFSTAILREL